MDQAAIEKNGIVNWPTQEMARFRLRSDCEFVMTEGEWHTC